MELLVLGGTGWLGREVSAQAVGRGHRVTCLARGRTGPVADGARLVAADRELPGAYREVAGQDWDAVVELSWQPGLVADALAALADRAPHWCYVSSISSYASHTEEGADESAALLSGHPHRTAGPAQYGEAKVACEQASRSAVGDRLLVVRPGLIGGPGDDSDRSGAWVARAARDPGTPMLAPDAPDAATSVVDVRDLAAWLVDCAERQVTGSFDAVGPAVPLQEWIAASRRIGGHRGPVVRATDDWLLAQGVAEFAGPDSLALWIANPGMRGFATRSGAASRAAGLTHRPYEELLREVLVWERAQGLGRPRSAGLSVEREQELLTSM